MGERWRGGKIEMRSTCLLRVPSFARNRVVQAPQREPSARSSVVHLASASGVETRRKRTTGASSGEIDFDPSKIQIPTRQLLQYR